MTPVVELEVLALIQQENVGLHVNERVRIEPANVFAEMEFLEIVEMKERFVLDRADSVEPKEFESSEMLEHARDEMLNRPGEECQRAELGKALCEFAIVERTKSTLDMMILQC